MKRSHVVALVMIVGLSLGAQAPFDQTFPPDVAAPQRFRTNRTSYSAIMDVLRPSRPRATQAMLDHSRRSRSKASTVRSATIEPTTRADSSARGRATGSSGER